MAKVLRFGLDVSFGMITRSRKRQILTRKVNETDYLPSIFSDGS